MAKTTVDQIKKKTEKTTEKRKALETAQDEIVKRYGKGSLMRLGDDALTGIEVVPTGAIQLDSALGVGGYPKGRIIEIYGPESAGKTTLALHAIAETQKQGEFAAFIDAEHALDPMYAKALGVDIDDLWLSQPDSGEQALEIAESLVRSGAVGIVVIDSVAALTPQAEIEGDMGDSHMGLQARLMSQALRKLNGIVKNSNTILVFINQIRFKIGVVFGNPETTSGGNALKFYASVRLEIRKVETISQGTDDPTGNRVRVKVLKNKVAPPFRKVELVINFGTGLDGIQSLVDCAVSKNFIQKSGSWYSRGEERIGQGVKSVVDFLRSHDDIRKEIEDQIRNEI